jgi:hypothetical protein
MEGLDFASDTVLEVEPASARASQPRLNVRSHKRSPREWYTKISARNLHLAFLSSERNRDA